MIGTGQWADALEKIARKNAEAGMNELPDNRDILWNVQSSQKNTETMFELGDISPVGRFTGTVNYTEMSEGYKFTTTQVEYALGIKIQRLFVDTDQQDVVQGMPKKLGLAMRRKLASDSVYHLNNAFNTSITTLDGLQLCSTAHTSANGGSNQSNLGTSAFSGPAVEATRILMRKYLTNTDQVMEVIPDTLIVGVQNEERAWEVIKSTGRVDTANNNPNFHKGRYKLLVDYRITGNKWFLADSRLMKDYCTWFELTKPEFNQDRNFDDYTAKYSMYAAYTYVPRDWRFIFGQNV